RAQAHLWVIDLNPRRHGARLWIDSRLQKVDRALKRHVYIRRCDPRELPVMDQRYIGFKNVVLNPYCVEIRDGVENIAFLYVLSLTDVTLRDDAGNRREDRELNTGRGVFCDFGDLLFGESPKLQSAFTGSNQGIRFRNRIGFFAAG